MKFNVIQSLISIAITALLCYGLYDVAKEDENSLFCVILGSVSILTTLLPLMDLQYDNGRVGANFRVLSGIFFVIFLISHFCFVSWGIRMPAYVMVNGLVLLIYLAVFYSLQRIRNI